MGEAGGSDSTKPALASGLLEPEPVKLEMGPGGVPRKASQTWGPGGGARLS